MIPGTAGCEGSRLGLVLKPKAIDGYGRVWGQKPLPYKPPHILRKFHDISPISYKKLPRSFLQLPFQSLYHPRFNHAGTSPPPPYIAQRPPLPSPQEPLPLSLEPKRQRVRAHRRRTYMCARHIHARHSRSGRHDSRRASVRASRRLEAAAHAGRSDPWLWACGGG